MRLASQKRFPKNRQNMKYTDLIFGRIQDAYSPISNYNYLIYDDL